MEDRMENGSSDDLKVFLIAAALGAFALALYDIRDSFLDTKDAPAVGEVMNNIPFSAPSP